MLNETVKAFVEGRGSMASLERAIEESENPLQARAEVEKELAAEWALKNVFATIPPPTHGLPRVMEALKSASAPYRASEHAEAVMNLSEPLHATMKGIPEPAGGFSAAIARLKAKLAATPLPSATHGTEKDVGPCFDSGTPSISPLSVVKKAKRATSKIVRLPMHTKSRDVLAAGKDLPENPNDIP